MEVEPMQRHWSEQELETYWSFSSDELTLIPQRDASSRLGVAASLKFFQLEGFFPSSVKDIPAVAIDHMAKLLDVDPKAIADYDWQGRTGTRYRRRLRTALGIRPSTTDDFKEVEAWLCQEVVPWDHDLRHLQDAVHAWYRSRLIEPATEGRIERLVRSAVRTYEAAICDGTAAKLLPRTCKAMDALIDSSLSSDEQDADAGSDWRITPFSVLKTDPGRVSLKSVLRELEKLSQIEALELPENLFAEIQPKILRQYRLRAAAEPPREVRLHPEPIRYTLLAAFCWQRRQEIIDGLVDLLIQIVHRISVRAEKKVVDELLGDLQKVHGKTTLLFKMAEAALEHPDGVVRQVLYPVVSEQTLSDLVQEYRSQGPTYRRHVYTILRASYSGHYRRMLPPLLDALDFQANTATHRPIIQALALIKANRESRKQHFAIDGTVPIEGVIPPNWRELVMEQDPNGEIRVNRINYEISALHSLREGLRCKAIWVVGADRFRNPDDDLPTDFDEQRTHYYAVLQQPESADDFIAGVRKDMEGSLSRLNDGLPQNPKVTLRANGKNRIKLSPLDPQPEPANMLRMKAELMRRWPMTSLLDVLKETDLRVGFSEVFHSVASREILDRTTLQPRLLRCLYGLGTNAGLKRVVAGDPSLTYNDLLYIRRRYMHKDALREAIARVANATFAIRRPDIWGEGTTSCASDAKKFGAWDQNLMTEWHIRYGGRGVMIYWHVEKKSVCIYSQLKRCSSSEVAAMIEGVLRHCTEMEVEQQYVDSHGQSEVAFAFSHLLGFDLMPRLKAIAAQKLSRPNPGNVAAYPNLQPILTQPINWVLIRQQYDEMIKYATALCLGTAEPESILRRFTRNNVQHPTYRALIELGKAIKTSFLARYLHEESLRREIHAGLNVVENWNSANGFIFYGKSGEIATNRLDDQELSVLSLHLLQACLVYINTLMLQDILAEPAWMGRMTAEDFRALSPLVYVHVNPYGTFELDMDARLPLAA
jgi:TnpA family transposase